MDGPQPTTRTGAGVATLAFAGTVPIGISLVRDVLPAEKLSGSIALGRGAGRGGGRRLHPGRRRGPPRP